MLLTTRLTLALKLSALIIFYSCYALALPGERPLIPQRDRQLILQQERQKVEESAPDIRLSPPATSASSLSFLRENPCFRINSVSLTGTDALPNWLPLQRVANRYSVTYLRQISNTRLTPQNQFSIGNRWSVHGFDGARSLSADDGWAQAMTPSLVFRYQNPTATSPTRSRWASILTGSTES